MNYNLTDQIATLTLEDGTVFQGIVFGTKRHIHGEVVFTTALTGIVETCTDPSYRGQIVVCTYPLQGNYGIPDTNETNEYGILKNVESSEIQVSGLIVSEWSDKPSHYQNTKTLSEWMQECNIPGIYGVDTRALTKYIRDHKVMMGHISVDTVSRGRSMIVKNSVQQGEFLEMEISDEEPSDFYMTEDEVRSNMIADRDYDPGDRVHVNSLMKNLAILTTRQTISEFGLGRRPRVLLIDCGVKSSMIKNIIDRGLDIKIVSYEDDFMSTIANDNIHGVFISSGPGNPNDYHDFIEKIKLLLKIQIPILGICLGHQILALASGNCHIEKLKYGHRGHNHAVKLESGQCIITSQNHGYAVVLDDQSSRLIPGNSREADREFHDDKNECEWKIISTHLENGTNEGMEHKTKPIWTTQYHPEACGGPMDANNFFNKFTESVHLMYTGNLFPYQKDVAHPISIERRPMINSVLVLGSGGIVIGQAGEFDYSGSQGLKALKEEGITTILLNSNVATVQTTQSMADYIYIADVTPENVEKIIKKHQPDAIMLSFGGQTALNCGITLYKEGILHKYGVEVIGTSVETILMTEDRERFAQEIKSIGEQVVQGKVVNTLDEAIEFSHSIGYPLLIRSGYSLGGYGSGIVNNDEELNYKLEQLNLTNEPSTEVQVIMDKSIAGWKEIEYEVVRDRYDNCITVCNMENFDPLGIHTGESIVIAPSQTLNDHEYQMLRTTAIKVIRHLGVIGECNIQYALHPESNEYRIIEVNARLSRSSALASKATGYPLAFVAAKLGLGYSLTEVSNSITEKTCAFFEPAFDYVVLKIPRWNFDKFVGVDPHIGTAMKSVGEVMSIGLKFEEVLQKAIRMLDIGHEGLVSIEPPENENLEDVLRRPTENRIYHIADAMHKGYTVNQIHNLTKIDRWFLHKMNNIIKVEKALIHDNQIIYNVNSLRRMKQLGFSNKRLATLISTNEESIQNLCDSQNIYPVIRQIDTLAGEVPASTNYMYSTYNAEYHDIETPEKQPVIVLGGGVYRVGSSVEFDWCCVACSRTLREKGISTVIINCNPETVSTDWDESDYLLYDELSVESIRHIYKILNAQGIIVSMGGQIPNNIASQLEEEGMKIWGTPGEYIDLAENRSTFSQLVSDLHLSQPEWTEITSNNLEQGVDAVYRFMQEIQSPVIVRPSYVLSGTAMQIVRSREEIQGVIERIPPGTIVTASKFYEEAQEMDIDAIAQDGNLLAYVISEHIEPTGIHSGDSTMRTPPVILTHQVIDKAHQIAKLLCKNLNVTGACNIQLFIEPGTEDRLHVIECNLRASRSLPFVSKALGINLGRLATLSIMHDSSAQPISRDLLENYHKTQGMYSYGIKTPQFSFTRLPGIIAQRTVEMKSTGEVAFWSDNPYNAFFGSLMASGFRMRFPLRILFDEKSYEKWDIDHPDVLATTDKSVIPDLLVVPYDNELQQWGINHKVFMLTNMRQFEVFKNVFQNRLTNINLLELSEYNKNI